MTMEQADKFKELYPELSRDTGGQILQMIYDGQATELNNAEDFKNDTLFCEWYYTIDLDQNEWRVYDSGKLVRTYQLDKLPTVDEFINSFKNDD